SAAAGEDIGRALIASRCVSIQIRADHDSLSADRHRRAEPSPCLHLRYLQLLLLGPDSATASEDIGRAMRETRSALHQRRADHYRGAADRHRVAENVVCRRV